MREVVLKFKGLSSIARTELASVIFARAHLNYASPERETEL
jgi:hypothetical protein